VRDTWEYDGTQWTQVLDIGQSMRRAHGMVYDNVNVLLHGGFDHNALGDTWAWDGRNWTHLQDMGPSPRGYQGLSYDGVRQRVVLFGGQSTTAGTALGDTWETPGTTLQQSTSVQSVAVDQAANPVAPTGAPANPPTAAAPANGAADAAPATPADAAPVAGPTNTSYAAAPANTAPGASGLSESSAN
jgi:hypothetical protein